MFRLNWSLFIILINLTAILCVVIDSNVGKISGFEQGNLDLFLGIPYGSVDRNNPFKAATPYPSFEGTFNATQNGDICPQITEDEPTGSVHCLTLNVYTPKNNPENLPVMVFIHGDNNRENSCNSKPHSPTLLVKKGVIVVTINFRLGPYGFLCWDNSEYSNQGLRDIRLATIWINNNINCFGGDKTNVLLFGNSAGSVLVEFMLLFNEDNLFNKVILQSGSAASPKVIGEYDRYLVNRITNTLGFDSRNENVDDIIDYLSGIEIKTLIKATENETFSPCIDGSIIKEKPELKAKRDIKIMLGNTDKEMMTFCDLNSETFFEDFDYKRELNKGFYNVTDEMVNFVKEYYLDSDFVENVVDFGTDFHFDYPLERSSKFYLENNVTVFRYVFTYVGSRNCLKRINKDIYRGATNGDEIRYLFDMENLGYQMEDDEKVLERMTTMWTNFAKYGHPTPETSDLLPVEWLPVTSTSKPYLLIASDLELRFRPYQQRMAFWHLFYGHYGINFRGIAMK